MLCQGSDTLRLVESEAYWVDWDNWNRQSPSTEFKDIKVFYEEWQAQDGRRRIKKVSGKQVVF